MSIIHLAFTGDIICSKTHDKLCEKKYYAPVFEKVTNILNDNDYVIGSLETTFSGPEAKYTKTSQSFNTPDAFAECLKNVGFDMLTTASNHCLDRGIDGLRRTINVLDKEGIDHTGTCLKKDEERFLIKEIRGVKIAFISCTYGTNSASNGYLLSDEEDFHVNLTKEQDPYFVPTIKVKFFRFVKKILPNFVINKLQPPRQIQDCVAESHINNPINEKYINNLVEILEIAKRKADISIVCLHSGGQYNLSTGKYTDYLLELFAKHGADLIIGNHTHSILPIRKIGDCLVFCSLGNFIYDPRELPSPPGVQSEYSIIPRLGFDTDDKKLKTIEYTICKTIINETGLAVVYPIGDLEELKDDVRQINNRLNNKRKDPKLEGHFFVYDIDS